MPEPMRWPQISDVEDNDTKVDAQAPLYLGRTGRVWVASILLELSTPAPRRPDVALRCEKRSNHHLLGGLGGKHGRKQKGEFGWAICEPLIGPTLH